MKKGFDMAENETSKVKVGKIYKVAYPTDHFVVNGLPVINSTGVVLTDEQAQTVLEAADASDVRIVEVQ
jgi:hypothetical protein